MVFACGCPSGGAKDWICKICGLCPEHCLCTGDTFTHIQTKEGVLAARAALTRLRDKEARAATAQAERDLGPRLGKAL